MKWSAFRGRLRLASKVETMSLNDFFVVKENLALRLHRTCGDILVSDFPTLFSFFPGRLSVFLWREALHDFSFWPLSRLQGWMAESAYSFQYEKFWTCLTQKPRRALLPLTSCVHRQDSSSCTLHRGLHEEGAVLGYHNYVFFAKQ